jgi:GNAT superfamily N-acetyltransferase
MDDIQSTEKDKLKPEEIAEAQKLKDALEARIDRARPATGVLDPREGISENEKLKLAVGDRTFDAATQAEGRLREAVDLSDAAWRVEKGDVVEHRFVDRQGRPLEVRLTGKVDSPADTGSDTRFYRLRDGAQDVGRLDLALEHSQQYDPQTDTFSREYERAKITYVEVQPAYRGAGSGSELLRVAEREARLHGVREIYGVPENEGARAFFERNAGQGWQVEDAAGYAHGRVRKVL